MTELEPDDDQTHAKRIVVNYVLADLNQRCGIPRPLNRALGTVLGFAFNAGVAWAYGMPAKKIVNTLDRELKKIEQ